MGLFWLVMGHVFHMISYVDCDVDCDMDSYMPGGGGMLTTDIEASRWSNIYIYIYLGLPQSTMGAPFLEFFFRDDLSTNAVSPRTEVSSDLQQLETEALR